MADPDTTPQSPKRRSEWLLTWLIFGALVLGAIVGQILFTNGAGRPSHAVLEVFRFIGETVFIGLLKMTVVPLVISSVVLGASSIGRPAELGRIGGATLGIYLSSMLIAAIIGTVLVAAVEPGDPRGDGSGLGVAILSQGEAAYSGMAAGQRAHAESAGQSGLAGALRNIAVQLIPSNPVGAMASGQILPVISFSLLLGVTLTFLGARGRPLLAFMEALFDAMLLLVSWILWLAPVGVFCLVAVTVAVIGTGELLGPLAMYLAVVIGGLAVQALVVLPAMVWLLGRTNPYRFMLAVQAAMLMAFTTASSSATLPVSMDVAVEQGGCSRRASGFVLPLGATINMDGTALYEAVAVVFLFQCYGIELGPAEYLIVVLTATLSAIGAAGIPSAGLVTMVVVVEAVNNALGGGKSLPLAAIGLVLGVDRIADMCRTSVNVWGDLAAAKIITRLAPDPPADPSGEDA